MNQGGEEWRAKASPRRGEEQGDKTENGDDAGAEIDGEAEAAGGRHGPEDNGCRAHRQIGQEIQG
jgi:hypothetical protein